MKILVFPKDSGNPYQSQLFNPMRAKGVQIGYLKLSTINPIVDIFFSVIQLIGYRFLGYSLFHIHWVYPFGLNAKMRQVKLFNTCAYWCYILTLLCIKFLGYKLVWTAHNALPHEPVFGGDKELKARKWLVKLADLVIVHSESTVDELAKIGLHPQKCITIPHGSYVDVYQNTISQVEARQKLGLREDKFIYLFLGQIRDYKGVDVLLEAYSQVRTENTVLVIAGACRDPELRKLLSNSVDDSIVWHDWLVPDESLQNYFNAVDVAVLPFKKITTSGSALLALSFGKAVIIPTMGDLSKLSSSISYKYNPTQVDGLVEAMVSVRNNLNDLQQKNSAARAYADKLAWPNIAEKTQKAFKELFTK